MSFKKNTLKELYFLKKGKIADKWESYLEVYNEEFAKYKDTNHPILEIGVQNCGSLEIWAKFFSKSCSIIGNDILEDLKNIKFDDARLELKICDSKELSKYFIQNNSPLIIIDDASHNSSDIIYTFIKMFPLLLNGGVYAIEDLCCSYYEEFNKDIKISSMFFLKSLADLVNYEHWQREQEIRNLLNEIGSNELNTMINIINSIKSIKFYNSLCFIYKNDNSEYSKIGKRIVVGDQKPLGFSGINGSSINDLPWIKRRFEFDDKDLKNKILSKIKYNYKKLKKRIFKSDKKN